MAGCACHQLPRGRLIEVTLDTDTISHNANPSIERERQMAIYDLLDHNSFELFGRDVGPCQLVLGLHNARLVFNVHDQTGERLIAHLLPLAPLKRIIRDYFIICDAYYEAIKSFPPSRVQAIDEGRRGLHDEGGRALAERLASKIKVDHDTARRLFTLICSLHWKG